MPWGRRAGCQNYHTHSVGGGQCPSRDTWTALQELAVSSGKPQGASGWENWGPSASKLTHPSPASMSALWSHRRRKQRRGRYRGSCTRSGAARSSLMSRAWWSCSWLSDGARPTGGEPVLSCCTAGTPGCTSIHGQPPELGATWLHSSSAWYQQAFPSMPWGHVDIDPWEPVEVLSPGGSQGAVLCRGLGEDRADGAGPGAWVEQAFPG